MSAKLVAEEGDLKGLILSFDEGDHWVIGRDPDECQLIIEDASVSRRQALCRLDEKGYSLENLSDTNPIFINDEEVKEPKLIQHGDTLKFGNSIYRFYSETTAHLVEDVNEGQSLKQEESKVEAEAAVQLALLANPETTEEEKHEDMKPDRDTILEDEEAVQEKAHLAEINFNLLETGRWLLKVIGGPNNGAEFSMQSGKSYIIGTDPNICDIVFHDTSVSRQHARLSISDDDVMSVEDLKSRNGTLVDGRTIQGKQLLNINTLVTLGTTSFIVYDREGEMHTIISPLLPSIVKVLQQEEPKKEEKTPEEITAEAKKAEELALPPPPSPEKNHLALGSFILISVITGLFILVGIGTLTLFRSEPVTITQQIDEQAILKESLAPFPNLKYSFTKSTGNLLLLGHVLTPADKSQLLYNLQALKFVKSIDDSAIVVDEYEAQEINLILSQNPNWKGLSIQVPSAGKFVVTGYLKDRKQAEQLSEYLGVNFRYPDLLTNRVVVEEDILSQVSVMLREHGLRDVTAQMSNGEVTLSGTIPGNKKDDLTEVYNTIKNITGVREVKSYVVLLSTETGVVDLSDKYEVSGISHFGDQISVVINGKILTTGDVLDGMMITSIKTNMVLLEKEGTTYRINIKQ